MDSWTVQDAKARFSEFLQSSLSSGPQMVTRRGQQAAVLVSIQQWQQLQSHIAPSLKSVLLEPAARDDLLLPQRGQSASRPILDL
jgi:antitoxin Phd